MSDPRPPDRPVNAPPVGEGKVIAPRSAAFQRFMAVPLIFGVLLMLATAVLAVLSWFGGEPEGPRATIVLQGSCVADARPLLAERASALGLGDPQWSLVGQRLELQATLPGLDDDLQAVPQLLVRRGLLELRQDATVIIGPEHVEGASIRLDESGVPYTWIDLSQPGVKALTAALEADPQGELAVSVDGMAAVPRPNTRGVKDDGIRVLAATDTPRERMRASADIAIVLTHGPLPCELDVVSATPVAAGGGAG